MSKLKNAHALIIGTEYDDGLDTNGDAKAIARILKDPTISLRYSSSVIFLKFGLYNYLTDRIQNN